MSIELGKVGIWRHPSGLTPEGVAEVEALGYGTIWVGGSPPGDLDVVEHLLDTTDHIAVATGIVNVWKDDAATVGASYHRITGRHPGRFLLGLGMAKVADTAAQGTPLEPYAGPAAALFAGGLGVRGKAPEVSIDAAKAATNASYDAARNAGVMYDQNAIASRAAAAKADLTKRGISEQSAPSAHDTLDSFINNTSPMSLTSLEEQRQLFTKDAGKGGKEGFAANAVKGVIDDVMSDPRNAAAWSGTDPATAYALLQKGRTQALATQRLRDIEDLQSNAQVNKDVNGTDLSKTLRTQFGSELKKDNSTLSGNPGLAAQMQNISKGSFPQGIASRLGGGDLSKWRALELAGLAFPVTMPAVVGARAL
ncbi:MAG: hypothetical protein ACLQB1_25985, partial [Streptosporangiaceae bacterium]